MTSQASLKLIDAHAEWEGVIQPLSDVLGTFRLGMILVVPDLNSRTSRKAIEWLRDNSLLIQAEFSGARKRDLFVGTLIHELLEETYHYALRLRLTKKQSAVLVDINGGVVDQIQATLFPGGTFATEPYFAIFGRGVLGPPVVGEDRISDRAHVIRCLRQMESTLVDSVSTGEFDRKETEQIEDFDAFMDLMENEIFHTTDGDIIKHPESHFVVIQSNNLFRNLCEELNVGIEKTELGYRAIVPCPSNSKSATSILTYRNVNDFFIANDVCQRLHSQPKNVFRVFTDAVGPGGLVRPTQASARGRKRWADLWKVESHMVTVLSVSDEHRRSGEGWTDGYYDVMSIGVVVGNYAGEPHEVADLAGAFKSISRVLRDSIFRFDEESDSGHNSGVNENVQPRKSSKYLGLRPDSLGADVIIVGDEAAFGAVVGCLKDATSSSMNPFDIVQGYIRKRSLTVIKCRTNVPEMDAIICDIKHILAQRESDLGLRVLYVGRAVSVIGRNAVVIPIGGVFTTLKGKTGDCQGQAETPMTPCLTGDQMMGRELLQACQGEVQGEVVQGIVTGLREVDTTKRLLVDNRDLMRHLVARDCGAYFNLVDACRRLDKKHKAKVDVQALFITDMDRMRDVAKSIEAFYSGRNVKELLKKGSSIRRSQK